MAFGDGLVAPGVPGTEDLRLKAAGARLGQLQAAQAAARSTTPDDHALALRVASQTGTDPLAGMAAVRSDKPRAAAMTDDLFGIARDRPKLADWLSDPHNYSVAQDDIPALTKLHDAIQSHRDGFFGGMADATMSGLDEQAAGHAALAGLAGVLPPDVAGQIISDSLARNAERAKSQPVSVDAYDAAMSGGVGSQLGQVFGSPFQTLTALGYKGVQGLAGMVEPIAGGAIGASQGATVGGAAGAVAGLGVFSPVTAPIGTALGGIGGATAGTFAGFALTGSAGQALRGLMEATGGKTDPVSIAVALRDEDGKLLKSSVSGGAVSAATMTALMALFPPGAFLKGASGVGAVATGLAKEAGVQGAVQTAGTVSGDFAATGKVDAGKLLPDALSSAVTGLGFSGWHALLARGGPEAVRDAQKAVQSVADNAALGAAGEAAAASKTGPRAPDRAAAMARSAAADAGIETLHVDREGFDATMTAAGKSPVAEAARLTGSAAAYDEARQSGVIAVPYGDFVTKLAGTPEFDALRQFTHRPGNPAPDEAAQTILAQAKTAQETAAEPAPTEPVDMAALDERAAALEADIGLPAGATRLFQSAPDVPSTPDHLNAAADALDAAAEGQASVGAEDPAAALRVAEPALRAAGITPDQVRTSLGETAAKLRELAGVRAEQAAGAPKTSPYARIRADAIAAGRTAREADTAGRLHESWTRTLVDRFHVEPKAAEAMAARIVRGDVAPTDAIQQGVRGAYTPATRVIELFATADKSTLFHELGHHFVSGIVDLAAAEGAHPDLIAFRDEILKAAGAEEGVTSLTPDQLERISGKPFEQYLTTGRAPSAALRRVFAAIRFFMVSAYRSARGLGIDVPPELRSVFDRMLATDTEIAAAEAERGPMLPIDRTAVSEADRPAFDALSKQATVVADAAADELTRKMMADQTRAAKAEHDAALAGIRKQEAARLNATPEFAAAAYLADHKLPDGSPLPEGAPRFKLDRAGLAEVYDEGTMAALEKAGYVGKDGMPHDMAAELFGFGSGNELVLAVLAAADRAGVIESVARQRLMAERPELYLDPKTRRVEARRALDAGDGRSRVLAEVIRFLRGREREAKPLLTAAERADADARRAAWDAIPSLEVARETAARVLSGRELRDIRPRDHLAAARREAGRARTAAAAGDDLGAAQATGREMILHEMYRQAQRITDRAGIDSRGVAVLSTAGRQEMAGRTPGEWKGQMNRLTARFGLGKIRPDEAAALTPLREWLDSLTKKAESDADNAGATLVPLVADWLLNDTAKDWTHLTAEQLAELRASVESIYTIASDFDKARASAERESLTDRINAVVEQFDAHGKPLDRGFQTPPSALQKGIAVNSTIDRYVYEIDGGPGGPLARAILFPRNEGEAAVEVSRREVNTKLAPIWRELPASERATLSLKRQVPGVSRAISHEQRLVFMLYEGSPEGRQRNRTQFSEAEADAIRRTMTTADARWLNGMWSVPDAYWVPQAELWRRMHGAVPPRVEPVPMTFKNAAGEDISLTGGYARLKYRGQRAHEQSLAEVAGEMQRGGSLNSTIKMGARFERAKNVGLEPRYDFGVIYEGLGETITGLALIERLHDINFVLRSPKVREAFVKYRGEEVYDQFRDSIRALAGGNLKRQSAGERASQWFRNGVAINKLGFKAMTQVVNASGITNSIDTLGPDVAKESALLMLDPRGFARAAREMWDESSTMATRATTASRDAHDMRATLNSRFNVDPLRSAAMAPMTAVQLAIDLPTYRVARAQALERGETRADAIRIAEQAVKDTQGSGFPADIPRIMRDQKTMTLFLGFLNRTMNLAARRTNATDWHSPASIVRLGTTIGALFAVPAMIQIAAQAVRGDRNDDPFWLSSLEETASNALGGIPYVRDLASAVKYGRYTGPAELSLIPDAARTFKAATDGDMSERDWQDMLSVSGYVTHLPMGGAVEAWRGAEAVMDGDAGPQALILGAPRK